MPVVKNEIGYFGEPEEIAPILRAKIDQHKPHAMRCLDAAFEFIYSIQLAPTEEMPETGELGTDMAPLFARLGEEFHVEFTNEQKHSLYLSLMEDFLTAGGMSLCAVWRFAHVLEHMTFHEIN